MSHFLLLLAQFNTYFLLLIIIFFNGLFPPSDYTLVFANTHRHTNKSNIEWDRWWWIHLRLSFEILYDVFFCRTKEMELQHESQTTNIKFTHTQEHNFDVWSFYFFSFSHWIVDRVASDFVVVGVGQNENCYAFFHQSAALFRSQYCTYDNSESTYMRRKEQALNKLYGPFYCR